MRDTCRLQNVDGLRQGCSLTLEWEEGCRPALTHPSLYLQRARMSSARQLRGLARFATGFGFTPWNHPNLDGSRSLRCRNNSIFPRLVACPLVLCRLNRLRRNVGSSLSRIGVSILIVFRHCRCPILAYPGVVSTRIPAFQGILPPNSKARCFEWMIDGSSGAHQEIHLPVVQDLD